MRMIGLTVLVVAFVAIMLLSLFRAMDAAEARPATWDASSTAYSLCSSGSVMADGSRVRARSAASNWHPLGTRIRLVGQAGPGGLRRWVIRDRIGAHSQLDFWVPMCGQAIAWGRRVVRYRIGWGER